MGGIKTTSEGEWVQIGMRAEFVPFPDRKKNLHDILVDPKDHGDTAANCMAQARSKLGQVVEVLEGEHYNSDIQQVIADIKSVMDVVDLAREVE